MAVQHIFPDALIHLEDFGTVNAFQLLKEYRNRACLFDDDIQGTAAVALAGIYSALRITKGRLRDQTFLFLGAGEAGIGIGELIVAAALEEGLSQEEARRRCWFVDSKGLIVRGRTGVTEDKQLFAHEHEFLPDFPSAIERLRPTGIIGVSGKPRMFTRLVIEAMARFNDRPIILALSNPTSLAECTAEEAFMWTNGKAIFASGSPFDPVWVNGKQHSTSQGNNAYIFPGVGMGLISCGVKFATDEMFLAAAKALAHEVSDTDLEKGLLYPPFSRVRDVSAVIAAAVANVAYQRGLARKPMPDDLLTSIRSQIFEARYQNYV
jgi:malate dehydrogenase (oxaloacetate-decarboxylating)(NADP+)